MARSDRKRVIIVTGASRGLGREIALCFGRAGERIVVNFLSNERAARAVAYEISQNGGESIGYKADVKNPVEVDAMTRDTIERWGAVDVLINNAALNKDRIMLRMTEEDWEDVVHTNLTGPFQCIRAAAHHMIKQRSGHVINISSIVGLQGREGQANYSSAKAGLIGLTKASAKELGPFNIKVNAVLPGYLPTDMGSNISDVVHDLILKENALGKASDPRETADFIYHLSLMNNVSGQVFNLDSRIV
jgi:3-oxoacyl-[acyl-carrier protein] reductase